MMNKQELDAIREKYLLFSRSDTASAIIIRLTDEIKSLQAERDASVRDMKKIALDRPCSVCNNDECHYADDEDVFYCTMFKWRGLEERR